MNYRDAESACCVSAFQGAAATANPCCGLLGNLVCSLAGTAPTPGAGRGYPFHTVLCSCEAGWCGAEGVKSPQVVSKWAQLGDEWAKIQPPVPASLMWVWTRAPDSKHSLLKWTAWQELNCSHVWSLLFPLL